MWCSVFETLPYVMGSLALAGDEHRAAPLPWVAYRDYSGEASVVAQKTSHGILDFTIATIRQSVAGSKEPAPLGQKLILESVGESGQGERAMDQVFQIRSGTTKARVPKDAPAGAYRVLPADPGEHVVMVHARNPTVLHAPGYWHLPDLAPGPRIYFKLPADARNARIFFEGRAKLFTPDGSAFGEVEGARGWIDLPQDKPGLWSFEPIENRLVRVRNIPPFFAFGGPEFYFEPPIAWEREEPVAPEPDGSEDALFVLGAIKEEGSRALRLTGRRTFKLEAGAPHLSGDGGQYLPHKEGTIEFWFRPEWSTFDLGTGAVSKRFINVMTSADTWSLLYRVDPNGTDINLGPRDPSHSLYGAMRVSREADPRRGPALHRSWLTETLFERGEWTHVVWSWGPEIVSGPRMERLSLMTMRIFVNGVGARSVVMRSAVDGIPVGVPESLHILPIEGSIDQFRISDVQRYTEDFAPPSRAKPFEADEHTRALFHFNGTLEGVGYGLDAPPTGVVTPSPSRE